MISAGEISNTMWEILTCDYKPNEEPFLPMMFLVQNSNLSFNGRILDVHDFFSEDSFSGNPELCAPPLRTLISFSIILSNLKTTTVIKTDLDLEIFLGELPTFLH